MIQVTHQMEASFDEDTGWLFVCPECGRRVTAMPGRQIVEDPGNRDIFHFGSHFSIDMHLQFSPTTIKTEEME
jgi:hypothetical protein